ncbi:MAG: CDP-alcohol phosphatidyltransferase [Acidobacteria bacterium]|nr:CDP-alcohol phosphatidyltransferase [Acidobacteriota bacterium]
MKRAAAWAVHLYTGMGLVAAAGIAVQIVHGGDAAFRLAFALMAVATLIDSTDGWLARRADVKTHAAGLDGRRLDDIIDFHTYTSLPLLLLWRAGPVGSGQEWCLVLAALASAYGFSQTEAKTEDNFFLGFPSYWNIVAFYVYLLRPPQMAAAAAVTVLAVLTFVPSRYLYPTQGGPYARFTNAAAAVWTLAVITILVWWQDAPPALVWGSLAFPAYYMVASWAVTLTHRQKK